MAKYAKNARVIDNKMEMDYNEFDIWGCIGKIRCLSQKMEKEERLRMFCKNCGTQIPEGARNCPSCGTPVLSQKDYQNPTYFDPYDHTAEFDPTDISENKAYCMLVYLTGVFGIIIALLASNSSRYTAFHVRQAVKFTVVETLCGLITLVLCWTVIVPIVGGIFMLALFVVKVICFFSICSGKAKEPPIIRSFGFLK